MQIQTEQATRVSYSASPSDGVKVEAVIVGTGLQDNRVTFRYTDEISTGSLEVAQLQMETILEFISKLQQSEGMRLGLIPTEEPPITEEPSTPTEEPPVTEEPSIPTEEPPVTEEPLSTEEPLNA